MEPPRKILLLNSDSPNNKGDRAILEGNLKLIRGKWPNTEVWIISDHPERDQRWHQVKCLPYPVYTVNPMAMIRIFLFAKTCDLIFWGGGELLKDYTNKIGILYWAIRIFPLLLCKKPLIGAFQGIGSTTSSTGQRIIVSIVNCCDKFIVRDEFSKTRLLNWGAKCPIVSSYDPAILNSYRKPSSELTTLLENRFDINEDFLRSTIGVGTRRWFHYERNGLLPHRYLGKGNGNREIVSEYTNNTAFLLDSIIEKYDVNVIFFPMFNTPSEGDDVFSKEIALKMRNSNRVRIISGDDLSPREYLGVMAYCRMFIASRLHSSILATAINVPAMMFFYSDKGRLFFEQIGMNEFSQPIENLLGSPKFDDFMKQIEILLHKKNDYQHYLSMVLQSMREKIYQDFDTVLESLSEARNK